VVLKNNGFLVFESLRDQSAFFFREDNSVELSEEGDIVVERTRILSSERQL